MYEEKYQSQATQINELTIQTACQEGTIQQRESRIEELLHDVSALEGKISSLKVSHLAKLEHLREEKHCVEKEKDFLQHESNTKEL
mmetsp:Transcript_31204/g.36617  ORF Transcript_31204/g.36617 Transcript_31204/m.36617 type:complete len:86 (+) Transcript_31204:341-598(+)